MLDITTLLLGIPAAVITVTSATVAVLLYFRRREYSKMSPEEWDVLKAIQDSGLHVFTADANDITFYMHRSMEGITYNVNTGWAPSGLYLSLSVRYRFFCQILVSRGFLERRDTYNRDEHFLYELAPAGVLFMRNEWSRLKKREYGGFYHDAVADEMELRKQVHTIHGDAYSVDETTESVDVIKEFPPYEHDPCGNNPCEVLCWVLTQGNKSLIEAPIGTATQLELGKSAYRDARYLTFDSNLREDGKMVCTVVYKRERSDGWFEVWASKVLTISTVSVGKSVDVIESSRKYEKMLLRRQNKIRDCYYGEPPLGEVARMPVPE